MLAREYSRTSVASGLLRRVEGLEGFLKYVPISREPHDLLNTHMMVTQVKFLSSELVLRCLTCTSVSYTMKQNLSTPEPCVNVDGIRRGST